MTERYAIPTALAALAATAALVVGCKKDEVLAIHYPDRTELSKHVAEVVNNLDQCRAWINSMAQQQKNRGDERRPDYTCVVDGKKVR